MIEGQAMIENPLHKANLLHASKIRESLSTGFRSIPVKGTPRVAFP
jgi:hypothetical protein